MVRAILAALSLLLALWQWVAAMSFPVHKRVSDNSFAPPVTLLKPLKGLDTNTLECIQSWLNQSQIAGTSPQAVQFLFGVASPDDPVCEPVRQLIREHPGCNAQLIICHESPGFNAKVSTLIQLLPLAQHEIIVVSDADVLVPPDFLLNVVAPLRDPDVGLVNCFYRIATPSTTAMWWKAIATNADFWSQVLQGKSRQPMNFALGAVMPTRREHLSKIPGLGGAAGSPADVSPLWRPQR